MVYSSESLPFWTHAAALARSAFSLSSCNRSATASPEADDRPGDDERERPYGPSDIAPDVMLKPMEAAGIEPARDFNRRVPHTAASIRSVRPPMGSGGRPSRT